jgi:hypothetical protein
LYRASWIASIFGLRDIAKNAGKNLIPMLWGQRLVPTTVGVAKVFHGGGQIGLFDLFAVFWKAVCLANQTEQMLAVSDETENKPFVDLKIFGAGLL